MPTHPIVSTCTPFPGTNCVTTPVPPTVGPMGPTISPVFEQATDLVVPIERNEGMVASILGVAYFRTPPGTATPLFTPLHPVYIALAQLNDDGTVDPQSPRAILVNSQVRFFTVLSDGERSVVPPFVGGGGAPYGFVISTRWPPGTEIQPGRLMYWWRWVPRATGYPSLGGC